MSMRVLHVIPSVAPRYGGPSAVVLGYCHALNALGIQTMVATTNADGDDVLPVLVGKPTRYEGLDAIFFERRGEAFKYSSGLARWVRQHVGDFDLVHIHAVFSHSSLVAGRACRATGVPYILRPLGSLDPWSLQQRGWKKRILLQTSAKALIQGAAAVHFTTDIEAELAAPVTAGATSAVVPLGIDAEYVDIGAFHRSRLNQVIAISRFESKKRLDALIRAFHLVAADPALSNWTLAIAGDGKPEDRLPLEHAAVAGPCRDRIRVGGWVDGAAKRELLASSSLFAMPSYQENFGLALAEAMAAGLPAIVTSAVNLSKNIERADAGWVVGLDEGSLVDALRAAMTNEFERRRRGINAHRLAQTFTWPAAGAALADLYRAISYSAVGARS